MLREVFFLRILTGNSRRSPGCNSTDLTTVTSAQLYGSVSVFRERDGWWIERARDRERETEREREREGERGRERGRGREREGE